MKIERDCKFTLVCDLEEAQLIRWAMGRFSRGDIAAAGFPKNLGSDLYNQLYVGVPPKEAP